MRRRPEERREGEESASLREGEERPAEDLAERDGERRDRRDDDGLQEPLAAVLDDGDRREDRGEENDEDDRPGEEPREIGDAPRRAEGGAEAGAEEDPGEERRREGAEEAARLAEEADDLAPGEGEGGAQAASADSPSASNAWPVRSTKKS